MPWLDSQIAFIPSCFTAAPGYAADILDLHAPRDRCRRSDSMGNFGPDATSPTKSYPRNKPTGPRGRLSASGN